MERFDASSAERLLDVCPLPALLLDGGAGLVAVNRHAAERLGIERGSASGVRLHAVFVNGEDVPRRLREAGLSVGDRPARFEDLTHVDSGARSDLVVGRVEVGGASSYVALVLDASERAAHRDEIERLNGALAEARRAREKSVAIQREIVSAGEAPRIIGASGPMLRMLGELDRVAPADATVLIHGESGSGKELVARAIHERSSRRDGPWIALNCAAMPETLLESELFGHERGAFTGADRRRLGKFELADGGTLFLDEIAELSPAAQAKLLRVLQDGTFVRVGGAETLLASVRLVAATHRDLAQQVQRGRFREDLFFRLNVFRLDVPPLRERAEDIKPLAEFFHERHARRLGREPVALSARSLRRMLSYRWPGNVRELENTIERATLLAGGPELDVQLPDAPLAGRSGEAGASRDTTAVPRDVLLDLTLDQLQRLQIMHALETSSYRVFGERGAAKKLGINPQTLLSRMDKLGVPRPRAMRAAMRAGGPG
jgi:transcriptional regulator with GAF, ATPase, and Fis domain